MSLAARRRSISERCSRSAIALNARASSLDSTIGAADARAPRYAGTQPLSCRRHVRGAGAVKRPQRDGSRR